MCLGKQSVASHTHPAEAHAHNPGMCPDQKLNQWPLGLWGDAHLTKHQQSEPKSLILNSAFYNLVSNALIELLISDVMNISMKNIVIPFNRCSDFL